MSSLLPPDQNCPFGAGQQLLNHALDSEDSKKLYDFIQERRQRKYFSLALRGRFAGMAISDHFVKELPVGVSGIGSLITTDAKSQIETNRDDNAPLRCALSGLGLGVDSPALPSEIRPQISEPGD